MTKTEPEVYRELQKHLDKFAIGFPATKSGVELKVLKHLFTSEEALIATYLSFSFEDVDTIYERIENSGISLDELKKNLQIMAKKGSIHYKNDGDKRLYANAVLVIGMYEYQVNNLSEEFIKDFFQYSKEAFGNELVKSRITHLRTIPVEKSITHDLNVANYENIREIINNFDGPIAVVKCICREAREFLGKSCKQTSLRETCFPFGWHAQFFIDNGWGRSVSKEEALEIFNKAEEDGLIVQASNTISPHVICCCCNCCCGSVAPLKKLPSPAYFFTSNFFAEIDPEMCIGCEICVDRCNMTAIVLANEKSEINLDRCIGCGNCVAVCPENAIQLKKKEKSKVPVETLDDLYLKIGKRVHKPIEKHK